MKDNATMTNLQQTLELWVSIYTLELLVSKYDELKPPHTPIQMTNTMACHLTQSPLFMV